MMNRILSGFLAAFCPYVCPFCGKVIKFGEKACAECVELFYDDMITRRAVGGYPCKSLFPYKEPYSNSVVRMKFSKYPIFSENFALCMYSKLSSPDFDLITYVPMYIKKERERGFNQAFLIARDYSSLVKIPCEALLEKIKDNKEQHTLPASERKDNVKGVYRAVNKEKIIGKNILVIDDVITTGNTLGECCKMLMRAKAASVSCLTVCAKIDA